MRIALALIVTLLSSMPGLAREPLARAPSLCRVHAAPLTFGTVDAIDNAPVEATGSLQVSCTGGTAMRVSIALLEDAGAGVHPLSDVVGAPGVELFLDPGRRMRWGDGLAGSARMELHVPGDGRPIEVPVYASLALPPGARGGHYGRSLLLQMDATPP